MKRILSAIVLYSLMACNNQSSVEKTADSTSLVIDSQKLLTKDSVAYKADSNKKVIDSTFKILKDSLKATR